MNLRSLLGAATLALLIFACDSGSNQQETPAGNSTNNLSRRSYFKALGPPKGSLYNLGDTVSVMLGKEADAPAVDSVQFFLDGEYLITTTELDYDWVTNNSTVGPHVMRALVHYGGNKESVRVTTTLRSNVVPENWKYQVVSTYPHDPNAFTQGLEFHDGFLYEGTGQKGLSWLRKVNLTNGEVLQEHKLEEQYFGEGITKVGDEIIQITWQARVGFVYDAKTFEEKRRFNYPTEGWGLAYTGEELVMSDGSNKLYFMQPGTFVQGRTLSVYDNNGPVNNLNELEYIDGMLYANIWMSNRIAQIDPATGRLMAYIDLTGILPNSARTGREDVLNGIAHDPATNRIFVTGKNWPKLFEVRWFKS